MKSQQANPPLCACGCGERVKTEYWGRGWNKFLMGHQTRGMLNGMYKKTHTPEARERISISLSERKISDTTREKLRNNNARAMLGRHHTEISRKLISEHHREMAQEKNPMWRRGHLILGSLNHLWKGGTSFEPYMQKWYDKKFRNVILGRDNWECKNPLCPGAVSLLTRHHIDYDKSNCDESNIVTLCNRCNSNANFNREYWTEFYREIMSRSYGYQYEKSLCYPSF